MEKQDLRVVKTIRQIEGTFWRMLTTMPFEKIKVEQLCREAMINRSTFYAYYQDKYDLLEQYLAHILQDFASQVDVDFIHASSSNISDLSYQQSFKKLMQFLQGHREKYLALWSLDVGRNLFAEMTDIVSGSILSHLHIERFQPEQVAYMELYAQLFASHMMTLVRWWMERAEIPAEQVEKIMADNMHHGMFEAFCGYMNTIQTGRTTG